MCLYNVTKASTSTVDHPAHFQNHPVPIQIERTWTHQPRRAVTIPEIKHNVISSYIKNNGPNTDLRGTPNITGKESDVTLSILTLRLLRRLGTIP